MKGNLKKIMIPVLFGVALLLGILIVLQKMGMFNNKTATENGQVAEATPGGVIDVSVLHPTKVPTEAVFTPTPTVIISDSEEVDRLYATPTPRPIPTPIVSNGSSGGSALLTITPTATPNPSVTPLPYSQHKDVQKVEKKEEQSED